MWDVGLFLQVNVARFVKVFTRLALGLRGKSCWVWSVVFTFNCKRFSVFAS